MKSLFSLGCAVLLALAFVLPAHADEGRGEGRGEGRKGGCHKAGKLFAKFDADKSGSLTSDEVPAKLWSRLSKADANGDGAVTKDEAKAACKARKGARRDGTGRRGGGKDA